MVLTNRRNLSGTRPKSTCGKSSSCRFSFSAARKAITKATEYITFGLSFRLLLSSLSKKVWMSLSVSGADFWSVLEAIIWKNSDKPPWIEDGEGFAVRSSTWPRDAKGEWCDSSWLTISDTGEIKTIFFHVCCSGFSQGWESLYNTVVHMINFIYTRELWWTGKARYENERLHHRINIVLILV